MTGLVVNSTPIAAAGVVVVVAGWLRSRRGGRPINAPPGHAVVRTLRLRSAAARRWERRRLLRQRFGPADLATWIDDLARSVRRGITLRQTISDVRPSHPALSVSTEPLRHRLRRGADVAEAATAWGAGFDGSSHRQDRHLRSAASVLSISSSVGGGSAAPLDRLAAALRQHAADDLERSSQSAQALISARVLTCVPVAVLALLVMLDSEVRAVLRSPTGAAVVSCGLVMNVFGGWWMRRIITRGAG